MEINLVAEGFKFMILGMVTVFLFLFLMVYVLKAQYILLLKFFSKQKGLASAKQYNSKESLNDDTALMAVITAAIEEFRKTKA